MHIDRLAESNNGSCSMAAKLQEPVSIAMLNMQDALKIVSMSCGIFADMFAPGDALL